MNTNNLDFNFDDVVSTEEPEIKEVDKDTTKLSKETVNEPDESISIDDFSMEVVSKPTTTETKETTETLSGFKNSTILKPYIDDERFLAIKSVEDADAHDFADLIDLEADARVEETFNSLREKVGDLGVAFLKYAQNGTGDPDAFLKSLNNAPIVSKLPYVTEEDKEQFLSLNYQKFENKSKDEADALVKYYKDSGVLVKIADDLRSKRLKEEADAIANLVKTENTRKTERVQERLQTKQSELEFLTKVEDVLGLPINTADKKKLTSYTNDYTFETKEGKELTKFDVDLNKALSEPAKKYFIAKLLMSNFNIDALKIKAKNEVTDSIRNQTNAQVRESNASSMATTIKSMGDFIDML